MKIDMTEAKKVFKEYVKDYNIENPKIRLKVVHIEKVAEIAERIAEKEGLNKEDIKLAELIGLLHDIGRFEQIKQYNTFSDRDSINHGEFGVKILFEEGLIRKFIETDEFDEIIKKAILNHNRKEIEEGLNERELLHSKMIRDADKADIYRVLTTDEKKTIYGKESLENEKITPEVYSDYVNEKYVDYLKVKTPVDLLLCHFKYVNDFNFKESKEIVKENKYIEKLYSRFKFNDKETQKQFDNVFKLAMEVLN